MSGGHGERKSCRLWLKSSRLCAFRNVVLSWADGSQVRVLARTPSNVHARAPHACAIVLVQQQALSPPPWDPTSRIWSRTTDQIESRSAFAAACRRSLTSASSRAARSMRSCCVCARFCWLSTRSCWLSARACWRSARSVIALRSRAISSTVRVSSASCSATLAMSSRVVTFRGSLLRALERSAAAGGTGKCQRPIPKKPLPR